MTTARTTLRAHHGSHAVLTRAVQICGREVGPNRYQLLLSQRRLAGELHMSIGNLRYHLGQVRDQIITLSPLCVELFDGDHQVRPAVGADCSTGPAGRLKQQHAPAGQPADGNAIAVATALLSCAAELHANAALLIERAVTLLTYAADPAQNARPSDHEDRANRANQTVSKSDSLSEQKSTDLLTPQPARTARPSPARSAPQPRETAPNEPVPDDELATLLGPLVEHCRRTNTATVDRAGRERIALHDEARIRAGVAHTLALARREPNIRSPFGILIKMLDDDQLPLTAPQPAEPLPIPVPIERHDPVLWSLAERHATSTAFWDAHIAPLGNGPGARCPQHQKSRVARIYGELVNRPQLVDLAARFGDAA